MRSRLDIVYVTHDSIAEGIGMSQIVPVVIGLAKKGWRVGIISCEKNSPSSEIQKQFNEASVTWKPLKFGRAGAIGGAGRLIRIAFNLPRAKAYHCRGDLASVAKILSSRSPFLWDVRGLWIDQKLIIGRSIKFSSIAQQYLISERKACRATRLQEWGHHHLEWDNRFPLHQE